MTKTVTFPADLDFDDVLGGTSFAEMRGEVQAHLPGQHDQQRHAGTGTGTLVQNYQYADNVPYDIRSEMDNGMFRVQQRFGEEMTENVVIEVTMQGRPGAYAWTEPSALEWAPHRIYLNPNFTTPTGRIDAEKQFKKLHQTGHFVKTPNAGIWFTPWEYVIIHEMGHVASDRHTLDIHDFEIAWDRGLISNATLPEQLSRYAMKNSQEYTAEAFVDLVVNGDDALPSSQVLMELIEETS